MWRKPDDRCIYLYIYLYGEVKLNLFSLISGKEIKDMDKGQNESLVDFRHRHSPLTWWS